MDEPTLCDAGRTAFFGGRWGEPCPAPAIHVIGSPDAEPIRLCDEHFGQVNEAGLVDDVNIGDEDFQRREAERLGSGAPTPPRRRRWFGRN